MSKVPLLDLKAQYVTIQDDIQAAIQRVVESQYFILGPEVTALEAEIANYVKAQFGVGVSSGTDALLLALMVLELEPGDEVITTAYSFFATAGAPARLGLKPVFVDINPHSYNIDPEQIAAKITDRTKVVIPVHLYGQVADMAPIMQLADQHGLTVIEDAAQAIGAKRDGVYAGNFGHMTTFSFFPSKNLGAFGDAGMVVTNDEHLDTQLRLYRNHGYSPKYYNKVIGGNFRIDALQAAVLRAKLPYLDEWTAKRQANAEHYRRLFSEHNLLDQVRLPHEDANVFHIYNQFVIRVDHRDQLKAYLQEHGIGTEVYYPVPLHVQECFSKLGYQYGDLPESESAANETLALPVYPELTLEQLETVVITVEQFFNRE